MRGACQRWRPELLIRLSQRSLCPHDVTSRFTLKPSLQLQPAQGTLLGAIGALATSGQWVESSAVEFELLNRCVLAVA